MCGRAGTLLTFVPATQFNLLSGEPALTDYQFNRHAIHHLFCKVCGIKSFARGMARTARRWPSTRAAWTASRPTG